VTDGEENEQENGGDGRVMVSDSGCEGREHVIDGEENEHENGDEGREWVMVRGRSMRLMVKGRRR